jgi:DNA polymerase III subunit beta
MTIATTREALRKALAMVTPAANARSSMEILAGVLFSASDAGVALSCSDAVSISASAPLECKHNGEAFVLVADTARKVIEAMPEGDLSLALAERHVVVTGGSSTVKLPFFDARDFPTIPRMPESSGKVSAATLARLLSATRHSARPGHPSKDGTHIRIGDGKIAVTTTGGHSFARAWDSCEGAFLEAFVPSAGVAAILKALSLAEDDAEVSIAVVGARLFVAHVAVQLYDEKAPSFESSLLKLKRVSDIRVPRDALLGAIRRVMITADDTEVILSFQHERELVVSSRSTNGETSTTLPANVPDADRIHVSGRLLLEQLEQLPDDETCIQLTGGQTSPLLFESTNYKGLAMPMTPGVRDARATART